MANLHEPPAHAVKIWLEGHDLHLNFGEHTSVLRNVKAQSECHSPRANGHCGHSVTNRAFQTLLRVLEERSVATDRRIATPAAPTTWALAKYLEEAENRDKLAAHEAEKARVAELTKNPMKLLDVLKTAPLPEKYR